MIGITAYRLMTTLSLYVKNLAIFLLLCSAIPVSGQKEAALHYPELVRKFYAARPAGLFWFNQDSNCLRPRTIPIPHPVPVLVVYLTAEPDARGGIIWYKDPYHLLVDNRRRSR